MYKLWPAVIYSTNSPSSYVDDDGKKKVDFAIDQIHVVNNATHSKKIETCLGVKKTFESENNLEIT